MATMKPLNVISTEPLNANREAKNPVLTESDGQAFAQTLRQQMQQETNLKAQRDAEKINTVNRLETQSGLSQQQIASQQQTERARLAMQNNQAKSSQVNKSSQATKPEQVSKVAQAAAPAQNNAIQTRAMQANADVKETDSNKAQNDTTTLTAQLLVNDETAALLTEPLQTMTETIATTKVLDTVAEQDAKQAGVDENAIANMGWLASMMAMRDNQAIPTNKLMAKDTESTLASDVLSSDSALLMTQIAQADGLSDKTALHVGEENTPLAHLPSMQANSAANNTASNDVQGLSFGKAIGSENELASLAKENLVSNGSLVSQPGLADNQSVGITKASEQLTTKLESLATDNMQSALNAQATATFNTANASMVSEPQMMSAQVNIPFGIKGWQEAMNNQVMRMTQQGNEMATLTLSPPDLGPVQVVLRVENQSVDAAFVSDNANVRQALEDGLQDLKERMASQGLQLGNTFVGNGNQAQQRFGTPEQPAVASFSPTTVKNTEVVSAPVRTVPLGLVDTFV